MSELTKKAEDFRALHVRGRPLVLFNVWDAGSAKAVDEAGAKALATGSWSVAAANGFVDGEAVPLALVVDNLARIVRASALPVTIDIESGYGATPEDVGGTIGRTIAAGAIGCNIEDSVPGSGTLRDVAAQVERIRCARAVAAAAGIAYFINARTDVFFAAPEAQHDAAMVDAALTRAHAYAEAGADGLFAPGLVDRGSIARLAAASPLPLNIMVVDATPPLAVLAEAGVARISHGPRPYLAAMRALSEAARRATGA